ncbi:MAG: transglycosylase domain-containing protein [Bacilli bacterium]
MKFFKKIFSLVFLIILIVITFIGYKGYKMYKEAINKTSINEKINEIKKQENYTTLDNISKDIINAVIAVEDHRFYEHKGIDLISTTKALFTNLKQKELVTGGSSITQQLAKNMYFSQEKQFSRKFAEIFIVSYLEENLTKDEILELYLNTIYYGNGYYGIGNASLGYFNKTPNELTISEASIIAGLPNAPSAYSLTEHKDLAIKRQKQVLEAMAKYKYIKEKDIDSILKED